MRLTKIADFRHFFHGRNVQERPYNLKPQYGMQEVSGSIPLGSTNFRPSRAVNFLKNW